MLHLGDGDGAAADESGADGDVAVGHDELVVAYRDGVVVGIAHIPSREEVTRSGTGRQGDSLVLVGRGRAGADATVLHRVAGDRMGRQGIEVGDVGAVVRHVEGIGRVGRHLRAVLRPVHELIVRVGCGHQRTGGVFIEGSSPTHVATCGRVGRHGDGVLRDGGEGGRVSGVFGHGEGVGGIGAHHTVTLLPVGESVARVGCGRQGAVLARVVGATAAHDTSCSRACIGRNGVGRTAVDADSAQVGHLVVTEHTEGQLLPCRQRAVDANGGAAVAHRGLTQDVVAGIGDGGHGTVAVADGHRIGRSPHLDGAGMAHRHGLRGLGAEHQARVTIDNPSLVGTDSIG